MGARWRISRSVVSLNEGGHVATFYWNASLRYVRIWVKPIFWRAGGGIEWQRKY